MKWVFNPNKVKARLAELGYTQKDLAECLGVQTNTLSIKLSGKRKLNVDEISNICEYLKTEPNYLFSKAE